MQKKERTSDKLVGFISKLALACCLGGIATFGIGFIFFVEFIVPIGWIMLGSSIVIALLGLIIAFPTGVKLQSWQKMALYIALAVGISLFSLLFLMSLHVKFRSWYENHHSKQETLTLQQSLL